MTEDLPILEFDPDEKGIVQPSKTIGSADAPERGVMCFYLDVIKHVLSVRPSRQLEPVRTPVGDLPVHEIDWDGRKLALLHPGVGAPWVVAHTEEMIARGCRVFVAIGGAGVLDRELVRGHLMVPCCAVRDEGTSFHYAAPSREIAASQQAVDTVETVLREHGVSYTTGKTWTTDAYFRETPSRVARRKAEGCLTVEMEAAALFAVAQFRKVTLAYILFCGDDVSGDEWDRRQGQPGAVSRKRALELAMDACLRL